MLVDAAIIAEEIVFSHEKYLHYIFLFNLFCFHKAVCKYYVHYHYIYYISFYFWVGKCSDFLFFFEDLSNNIRVSTLQYLMNFAYMVTPTLHVHRCIWNTWHVDS